MTGSIEQNPYAAPLASSLPAPASPDALPTIEEALARRYDFGIGALLAEAWDRTQGCKGLILGGAILFGLALYTVAFVIGLAVSVLGFAGVIGLHGLGTTGTLFAVLATQLVVTLLSCALSFPLLAGILTVAIRRAADQPVSFGDLFTHFDRLGALFLTATLMMLLTYLGFLLFVIPGLYLSIAWLLAIPLVAERGLSPWRALETSRRAISQHWFKVFGLYSLICLLLAIGTLPLGIGLIWTLPLAALAFGVLYRTIFGAQPAA
jgi:hypothetical protein